MFFVLYIATLKMWLPCIQHAAIELPNLTPSEGGEYDLSRLKASMLLRVVKDT